MQAQYNKLKNAQTPKETRDPFRYLPLEVAIEVCRHLAMRDRVYVFLPFLHVDVADGFQRMFGRLTGLEESIGRKIRTLDRARHNLLQAIHEFEVFEDPPPTLEVYPRLCIDHNEVQFRQCQDELPRQNLQVSPRVEDRRLWLDRIIFERIGEDL